MPWLLDTTGRTEQGATRALTADHAAACASFPMALSPRDARTAMCPVGRQQARLGSYKVLSPRAQKRGSVAVGPCDAISKHSNLRLRYRQSEEQDWYGALPPVECCCPPEGLGTQSAFDVPRDRLSVGHSLHAECLDVPQDRLSVGLTPPSQTHPTSM